MKQSIGNADPSTGFVLLDLLNEALREVFGFHPWDWREGGVADIAFVSGQSYAALPADFGQGQLTGVHGLDSTLRSVVKTTLQHIADLRGMSQQSDFDMWVAVSSPTQTSTTVSPGQPRLELWPTPGASLSPAMRVTYRRGPAMLTSNTQVPNIPLSYESALSHRALAKAQLAEYGALSDEGQANLALSNGLLTQLVSEDGAQDGDLGVIRNGAVVNCFGDGGIERHFNPDDIPR